MKAPWITWRYQKNPNETYGFAPVTMTVTRRPPWWKFKQRLAVRRYERDLNVYLRKVFDEAWMQSTMDKAVHDIFYGKDTE